MKGFNIAAGGQLPPVDEFFASLHHEHGAHGSHHASLQALLAGRLRTSQSSLSDGGAQPPGRKPSGHKRRWNTIIDAARAARVSRFIGRSRSEDSVCEHTRASASPSDRSDSGSDERRSPERSVRSLRPLSALAALKSKRKKFSDSRRSEAARVAGEALQRASSVPARAPPPPAPRAAPPAPALSPSTTAESVAGRGGSREPLLASLDDDAHKVPAPTH